MRYYSKKNTLQPKKHFSFRPLSKLLIEHLKLQIRSTFTLSWIFNPLKFCICKSFPEPLMHVCSGPHTWKQTQKLQNSFWFMFLCAVFIKVNGCHLVVRYPVYTSMLAALNTSSTCWTCMQKNTEETALGRLGLPSSFRFWEHSAC